MPPLGGDQNTTAIHETTARSVPLSRERPRPNARARQSSKPSALWLSMMQPWAKQMRFRDTIPHLCMLTMFYIWGFDAINLKI
jgi:hypothetical protein